MPKLNSEYVVKYYNHWIEYNNENCLYIQMEYCSDNLKSLINEKAQLFNTDNEKQISIIDYFISSQMFKELIEGLNYLHSYKNERGEPKPIIHRDLKPENILFTEYPTNGVFLKICDFGLSRYLSSGSQTMSRDVGTLKYNAPEKDSGKYTTKVDIYSLGLIGGKLFGLEKYENYIFL